MTKQTDSAEYTVDQVAAAAGASSRTVRGWIARGHLDALRATPRSPLRIPASAASKLLKRLGRTIPGLQP
jgi:excisionase family DNA binding protein